VHILAQEGISSEIASASADAVWRKMRSKDIRDVIKIGRLAKIKEDVDWIADTLKSYK
jgi:Holliday junction DNA helicase RuvB